MFITRHSILGMRDTFGKAVAKWIMPFGIVAYYLICSTQVSGDNSEIKRNSGEIKLTTGECSSDPTATCAVFSDSSGAKRQVEIYDGKFSLVDIGLMSTYLIEGAAHQLAYIYGSTSNATPKGGAYLAVLDLTSVAKIAWVASPIGYGVNGTYFSYIRGPNGAKYPFIAPGAHYLKVGKASPAGAYSAPQWDFLCIFDLGYIAHPDPACATGFKHYSTSFPEMKASGFRHGGGWVEDVDGDGWDDINLPFLRYILTISGKTGRQISLAHFDVAAQSEPNSPPYFHSGRFGAGFTAFVDPVTGSHDVLFTGGEGVGLFDDLYCGVSRYVAVAEWRPGPTLQLKWSRYLSFTKTIFKPPYNSVADYSRLGDDLNNCPHFFGTSLQWLGGKPFVVFSLFKKDDPSPVCQAELLAEQRSHFDIDASAPYEKQCAPEKIPTATGHWSVHILEALSGADLANHPNEYVWGEAPNVFPGVPQALLVQQVKTDSGDIVYNRTGHSADALALVRLVNGSSLDTIAVVAGPLPVPVVKRGGYNGAGPAQPPGFGSAKGGVPKLVVKDIDGDGLNDVQLQNGQWIGYSASQKTLIAKAVPSR